MFLLISYSRELLYWKLSTDVKLESYYYAFIGIMFDTKPSFFGQENVLLHADNGIYSALIGYGIGTFLSFYLLIIYILYKYFLSNTKGLKNDIAEFCISVLCFLIISSFHYPVFYKYGIKYLFSICIAVSMFYIKLDTSNLTRRSYCYDQSRLPD